MLTDDERREIETELKLYPDKRSGMRGSHEGCAAPPWLGVG